MNGGPIKKWTDADMRKTLRLALHDWDAAPKDVTPNSTEGCVDCLREGTKWVHLRLCLTCGNVGCCDSSLRKHATKHFHSTLHPVMRSHEPGEAWLWCFVHELLG